ncbi:MAG: MG2 domain-containing protein [Melioribacteraceae bacterium]|nr:MG2 domain-containing protein [Melioribacteraceae bacterium]
MKTSKSLIIILVLLILSCSSKDTVIIKSFTPTGETEKNTNFIIEFSHELAPPDLIGEWLTDEFIVFEPKIVGKYKWIDSKTLQFSPDYSLESMQDYKAKITKKVLYDNKLSADFDHYNFNTPNFDATKAEFFWTQIPHKSYTTTIQANIYFNYPVLPSQLNSFLIIKKGGEKITDFEIVTTSTSDVIAINLGEFKQTNEEQKIEIEILKGLNSVLGKKGLEENRVFDYELSKITKLDVLSVTSGFDGKKGWIDIYFNQSVIKDNLEKLISVEPKQNLDFQIYDNHIRISSELQNITSLTLKVKKGVQGLYGGELDRDYERVVSLVNIDPSINFVDSKGKYLMLPGSKNLAVNAVNIDKVDIEVSQIHKNNIIYYKDKYRHYNNYYYSGYYDSPYYNPDSYMKALFNKTVSLKTDQNWINTFNVNLEEALDPSFKGIFLVEVRSNEKRWIKDSKIVSISDLGIITKKSNNELIVFINSISSAEPVKDVKVQVISNHNTEMYSDVTNAQGAVKFPLKDGKRNNEYPKIIYLEKEGDFNYLDLREAVVETSRFDVGGLSSYRDNYKVFMYAERNLYRPGEKVNLSGILRDNDMKVISEEPVNLKIISPTGKVFEEYTKTLSEQGSYEQSVNMPTYAQTGLYKAELYTGAKDLIGVYSFSLEDFVPDKIRVFSKTDKEKYLPSEKVKISLDAEFLFGAKAAELKYEGEIQFRHIPFSSKKFKDYNFSNFVGEQTKITNHQFSGILDADGHTEQEYTLPKNLKSGGNISGYVYSSVFDLTGRTVNRISEFKVNTKENFIGIKKPEYYLSRNKVYNFGVVSVDKDDNPSMKYTASAKLIRYEWQSVLRKDVNGRNRYTSVKTEMVEWEKDIDISGSPSILDLTPQKWGQHELRLSKKGESEYVKTTFYVYGWSGGTASNIEIDKEGRIDMVFDKEIYEPTDKATVLFKCPFSGKLLVTIERDGIYDYRYLDIVNNSAQTTISLNEKYMPNVFVSATLFKKHGGESESPFLVGHGFESIKIEKKANKLPVEIFAKEKVKPNTTQEITVKTKPNKNIYVTFAAVDEGILQIKNFETPDAYKMMYAKRPLNVNSYDLYSLLLPEVESEKSSTGGDDLAQQLKKRVNPVTSKRYELLSFWSGIKQTNNNGEVKISLPIPQFNGEVRLMALVYDGPKFGSAGKSIKVSDDLIIEPEMPRFLSINDKLTSNVTLINTTDSKSSVTIKASVAGPVDLVSTEYQTVEVEGGGTNNVQFKFESKNNIGNAKIIFETEGLAKVKEEINIGVRPISPLLVETGMGQINAGETVEIKIPDHFIKSTQNTSLTISKLPIIKFAKHLKYILGYPYGCLEQTLSKVFPQLYFGDIAKYIYPELFLNNNSVYYVNEGIKKIESMALNNGSIAYWQGGNYSNWWSTVYAAHFLTEAKKAGFFVDENVYSKLIKYLQRNVKEKKTYDYRTYLNNKETVKKIANKETIYSLYILALAGKGDISTMNYYKSMPHLLSSDGKYLLAGAYALMENRTAFSEIMPEEYNEEKTDRLTGGSFDSSIRANAIMLNVLMEVDPTNLQVPYIVKYLSSNEKRMYSTQERSFTFLALGKALKNYSPSDVSLDVLVKNKVIENYNNKDLTVKLGPTQSENITLKSEGEGSVYYFWDSEGISLSKQIKEEDSQMKVRRSYYNYKNKKLISDGRFKQGDLIVCKISLTGGSKSAQNIAISDLIPAGFEIENPRLSTSTNFNWKVDFKLHADYMDIRDDRLILFTNLYANLTYDFYYMLRVVNKGEFQLPPIAAEAMYDREFHSFNGAGIITVE